LNSELIQVTVHLHTILQLQTPQGLVRQLIVRLPPESTLGDLLVELKISLPVDALLLALNGRVAEPDQMLNDSDVVNLMPAISGGRSLPVFSA
jgi:sulfur carrier protein ThiS